MTKLVLTMTMSLDGFFSGPEGELDWMTQAPDPEFSHDNVSSFDRFDRFDRGFIGYPTASGMLPYWLSVASNPQVAVRSRSIPGSSSPRVPVSRLSGPGSNQPQPAPRRPARPG
jgi:hypothetical protein